MSYIVVIVYSSSKFQLRGKVLLYVARSILVNKCELQQKRVSDNESNSTATCSASPKYNNIVKSRI